MLKKSFLIVFLLLNIATVFGQKLVVTYAGRIGGDIPICEAFCNELVAVFDNDTLTIIQFELAVTTKNITESAISRSHISTSWQRAIKARIEIGSYLYFSKIKVKHHNKTINAQNLDFTVVGCPEQN